MRTPSLERRAVIGGVATVAVVVIVLDVLVYFALATTMRFSVADALDLRVGIVADAARATTTTGELAQRLTTLGIPATVTGPTGSASSDPAVLRSRPGEELIVSADPGELATRAVAVTGDRRVDVFVSTAGVRAALRRLVAIEVLASVIALLAAYLLMRRGTAVALAPLDAVVAAAQRTAEGYSGQRLDADEPGSELGRLAVAYDHMLDELESALQDARDAEERGRRFLADAAHQLRTPLASIRAGVELLLIEPDPRRRDEHLGHLLRETTRGTRVLNALLTLARLDRGRHHERDAADLADLCRDEVDRATSLAPDLAIELIDERTTSGQILIDANGIREALANVLDNARRHAGSRITVTLRGGEGRTTVAVQDDGPGVPPGAQELVFERFATLDGKGGSGLGLPIARAVAREHGGDLTYDRDGFVLSINHGPARSPGS